MPKKSRADSYFLIITFLVVVLLGIPTYSSLVEDEAASSDVATSVRTETSRQPASIHISTTKPESALRPLTEWNLSCGKKTEGMVKVSGNFVQFQGKSCMKNFNIERVEIINRSNGYTASVFDSGSNKYQTDLIQLVKGENEITVRYQDTSGKTQEEVLKVLSSQI